MKHASFLKKTMVSSPLAEVQTLGSKGNGIKKHLELAPILPLTSLIDAFCIIVIYLLIGTQSGGQDTNLPTQISLPTADSSVALVDAPTVRIEKGQYFINDKKVAMKSLGAALYDLKTSLKKDDLELVVQADVKMDYADLDPLIKSASEAGIQKLKFAVMPTK
jgi:biopolymer transport protein ExbD